MQYHTKLIRLFVLSFFCLLALLFTACGSGVGISKTVTNIPTSFNSGVAKAPYSQQLFRIPWFEVQTFDPARTVDHYSDLAIRMMFGTLVQLDNNLQLQPYMAQSWSQSSDGLQWTFHLQSHLTYSDGTPLTSKDVAYSLDRALQPATQSTFAPTFLALLKDSDALHKGQLSTIIGDSILTPDDNTIILVLNKKAAYFLYTLTMPCASIVEKSMLQKYGNGKFTDHLTEGGTSGPFMLSQHLLNKEIDFIPNPYYYSFKPQLQKVVFITDGTRDSYRDYQEGLVDQTYVPSNLLDGAKQRTEEFRQTSLLETTRLSMNFLAKPFDNLHIRQAFALAINREKLNNDVFGGTYIPTYHIIQQGLVGYNLNLTGPAGIKDSRGNPNVARQLLQVGLREEGWSEVSQIPTVKLSYIQGDDNIATSLEQMWQSVLGIKVSFNPSDFTTFLKTRNAATGNPQGIQMWLVTWSSYYPDPHDWTTIHFGKGAARNNMNYGQNNSADALQEQAIQDQLERADAESNVDTRLSLYQSAEQQLINQVAWIPLYQWTWMILLKPYVKGLTYNALSSLPPMEWANIYIAAHS